MCYISNLFRPISKHEQKYDHLTKNEQRLIRKNGKVPGNDKADVNNQMSRKCKEENIMSYLKKISFFSSFYGDTEGGIQCFVVQS